jgi:glycosyltransferase involved in cell wall biosynthesis
MRNWQYVIVNNRSTDRTLDIAESYARRDSRIKIHTNQEFLSLMKNWNHAMRLVLPKSKYCKIVHADDWLFPECVEKMVEVAEAYPSVGIVGAYRLDEDKVNLDGLPAKTSHFLMEERYAEGNCWAAPTYSARPRRSFSDRMWFGAEIRSMMRPACRPTRKLASIS